MFEEICRVGVLNGADGSCELWRGESRAVVIVQGPCPISHEHEKTYRHVGRINSQTTSFHFDDPKPGSSLIHELIESCIDRDAYPRTEFMVHSNLESVHNYGIDVLLFNATSIALLDSAIQMKYYFAAVSVMMFKGEKDSEPTLECNAEPSRITDALAVFVFVFKPHLISPVMIGSAAHGRYSYDEHEKALGLAKSNCLNTFDYIRNQIQKKLVCNISVTE